jgi:hypothetical protein
LSCQPSPVGLRYLSRIARVHVRSAELALKALVREDLAVCDRTPTRTFYSLNRNCPETEVLQAVFDASTRAQVVLRSRHLAARARTLLPFIEESSRMIAHARR